MTAASIDRETLKALLREVVAETPPAATLEKSTAPPIGKRRPPEGITFNELSGIYLAEQRQRVASGTLTAKALTWKVRAVKAYATLRGPEDVSACRKSDLVTMLDAHPAWVSPHTQLTVVRCLISLWTWAVENEHISRQPFKCPRGLIPTPRPREAMTPEEFARIMHAARECRGYGVNGRRGRGGRAAFRIRLWFLWETGMRTCELKAARWTDLDWSAGVIRLEEHKTGNKTGDVRLIPLSRKALRLLRWIRRHRVDGAKGDGRIFLNSRGRPWEKSMINARFRQYKHMAGIVRRITPYSARHGFAVRGLDMNIGERQLAHAMGHRTTRYIEWYGRSARNNTDYLRRTAEAMSSGRPDAIEPPAVAPKWQPGEASGTTPTHIGREKRARDRFTYEYQQGNGGQRSPRATRRDMKARLAAAVKLLRAGGRFVDAIMEIAKRFSISPRTAEHTIRKARKQLGTKQRRGPRAKGQREVQPS